MWLCTVICIVYDFLSSFCWNPFILLRLRETHNVLQLSVFFVFVSFFFLFLCQLYPGLWNCQSVFLILKVSQYGGSRPWVQRFQGIHVRIDIRINISIFFKTYDHQIWQAGTTRGFDSNESNKAGAWTSLHQYHVTN